MKIKLIIWILFFLPLLYMVYKIGFEIPFLEDISKALQRDSYNYWGGFPTDPIKFISDITGITALQFLIATLCVTPLRKYTFINLQKSRRLMGLMSFFYAFNHMFLYFLLDHELSLLSLFKEAFDKWFIFFGMFSLLILGFLALTSTKKLFSKFNKWHQLIYLAALFSSFHYLLSQKIITLYPILYVLVFFILLLLRTDKIKKLFARKLK